MVRPQVAPPNSRPDPTQAAGGGPQGVDPTRYAALAGRLFEHGYLPLPIRPGTKRPAVSRWTSICIDAAQVADWSARYPDCGIGLRTGTLVGLDIDILDPGIAHQIQQLAHLRFGDALMRVGQWPKRLLLYRTETHFAKLKSGAIEFLGLGQQFVAFGLHPMTGHAYDWPFGDTPLDVACSDLPIIDADAAAAFLAEAAAFMPAAEPPGAMGRTRRSGGQNAQGPVRDSTGLVTDGRDGWLSTIAYHAVWDARDAGKSLDPAVLAAQVWARFGKTTDLSRPREGRSRQFTHDYAVGKVADKVGLLAEGRLPPRVVPLVDRVVAESGLPLDEARAHLDKVLGEACKRIKAWHLASGDTAAPRFGIRATVGLGKTAVSRHHLLAMQSSLRAEGLPHRFLVFTPSHVLAEESAAEWRAAGATTAVHRGYEARQPGDGAPMCTDLDMVRMATTSGQSVFANACLRKGGSRCHAFDHCLKQENLQETAQADVVIAPYDALFTGLGGDAETVAVLVIDEACWPRAMEETTLHLHSLSQTEALDQPRLDDPAQEEAAWTELFALRARAVQALVANGPGVLSRQHALDVGLTVASCATAGALEQMLRADPGLRPGLPQGARRRARELAQDANRSVRRQYLFRAMEQLLCGDAEQDGRIRVMPPDAETGAQQIILAGMKRLVGGLADKPILHLDATLRPALAGSVLPDLEVTEITADMPFMALTLVQGRFGKTTLCHDPLADVTENRRRANRLRECVDHVRWQARRFAPGRVLVVTYLAIEAAFAAIPGVDTGHFNAIAGLDIHKDVAALIVIGRPLPPSASLHPMAGAYFGREPTGRYGWTLCDVPMRDGACRTIKVMQHADPDAEMLRGAICDDEVLQAIGRGRGVNRTADNPLEVQVLADVALPLVHDRVLPWEAVVPDIVQRILLAGIAVDSPADAVALHPDLFACADQAKKAFAREGFKGQNPIGNTYREMSLKSARYRRGGKGRSWQMAYWLDGETDDVRMRLEQALGGLDGWEPQD